MKNQAIRLLWRRICDVVDDFGVRLSGATRKALFLRYAKTAGTLVTRYFESACGSRVVPILHWEPQSKERGLSEFISRADDFFKFTFIRNPWAWQVSFYFHFRQSYQNPRRDLFCEMFPTFESWIRRRHEHKEELFHSRFWWESDLFNKICRPRGALLPDFIGRVETMYSDLPSILKLANIVPKESFSDFCQRTGNLNFVADSSKQTLNTVNATSHDHYSSYYCKHTRELVSSSNLEIIELGKYVFE